MRALKRIFTVLFSLLVVLGIAVGLQRASHSSLFIVQRVDVSSSGSQIFLDKQAINKLVGVPLGKVSLFDLDLKAIERRLLSQDSIRSVKLQKKVLHTLWVHIQFREPKAVVQGPKGTLVYVDSEGRTFGAVNLLESPDLPVLAGGLYQNEEKTRQALELVKLWEQSALQKISYLSTVFWDAEKGFRVLATYSLSTADTPFKVGKGVQARTMIDIGQEIDETLDGKLLRLTKVLRYLTGNSIAVRQVWVDAGKKVVVKTSQGS